VPDYTVRALDEETWPAFAELVEANGGIFGGCWCMGMHPDREAGDTRGHRERKLERVRAGTTHAALVFDGERCLGWAQFGSPEEIPRIKNRAAYDKGGTPAPHWRIGCCYVGKGHRRQGVSAAALAGALDLIAALGGGTVEGYPEPADAVPAGFLFHGDLSTFERLGFKRERHIGKHRWVVSKHVESRSSFGETKCR
jgi:GNAT superfamily N-acetyltransferase